MENNTYVENIFFVLLFVLCNALRYKLFIIFYFYVPIGKCPMYSLVYVRKIFIFKIINKKYIKKIDKDLSPLKIII